MAARPSLYFFIGLLVLAFVLTYFIFKPFLGAIIIGIVLGVICRPIHDAVIRLFRNRKATLSALVSVIIVAVVILTPLTILANSIFSELQGVYTKLSNGQERITFLPQVSTAISSAASRLGLEASWIDRIDLTSYVRQGLQWLLANVDGLLAGAAALFVDVFVMLVALFYVFKDGSNFGRTVIRLSPLDDQYDALILERLRQTIRSVVRGSLIIGVIQGCLTGIGFAIFGVPNPVLWGSVASIAALIPGVGTALVLFPGVLYLIISGSVGAAIGLAIWAVICVGMVDNILGPKLVEQGVHIHPFFILVSALGGLAYYGPIGFVLGPLTLALLFALLDIYKTIAAKERDSHSLPA